MTIKKDYDSYLESLNSKYGEKTSIKIVSSLEFFQSGKDTELYNKEVLERKSLYDKLETFKSNSIELTKDLSEYEDFSELIKILNKANKVINEKNRYYEGLIDMAEFSSSQTRLHDKNKSIYVYLLSTIISKPVNDSPETDWDDVFTLLKYQIDLFKEVKLSFDDCSKTEINRKDKFFISLIDRLKDSRKKGRSLPVSKAMHRRINKL
jgi:hypothetical protein